MSDVEQYLFSEIRVKGEKYCFNFEQGHPLTSQVVSPTKYHWQKNLD